MAVVGNQHKSQGVMMWTQFPIVPHYYYKPLNEKKNHGGKDTIQQCLKGGSSDGNGTRLHTLQFNDIKQPFPKSANNIQINGGLPHVRQWVF